MSHVACSARCSISLNLLSMRRAKQVLMDTYHLRDAALHSMATMLLSTRLSVKPCVITGNAYATKLRSIVVLLACSYGVCLTTLAAFAPRNAEQAVFH